MSWLILTFEDHSLTILYQKAIRRQIVRLPSCSWKKGSLLKIYTGLSFFSRVCSWVQKEICKWKGQWCTLDDLCYAPEVGSCEKRFPSSSTVRLLFLFATIKPDECLRLTPLHGKFTSFHCQLFVPFHKLLLSFILQSVKSYYSLPN